MTWMSLSCSLSFESSLFPSLLMGETDDDAGGVGAGVALELELGAAEGDAALTPAFFNSSSFRFLRSCLARSSGFVELVNPIDFPSGDQTGLAAPFGRSVKENASPPVNGSMHNWP